MQNLWCEELNRTHWYRGRKRERKGVRRSLWVWASEENLFPRGHGRVGREAFLWAEVGNLTSPNPVWAFLTGVEELILSSGKRISELHQEVRYGHCGEQCLQRTWRQQGLWSYQPRKCNGARGEGRSGEGGRKCLSG